MKNECRRKKKDATHETEMAVTRVAPKDERKNGTHETEMAVARVAPKAGIQTINNGHLS
jgi:hypothetical protein